MGAGRPTKGLAGEVPAEHRRSASLPFAGHASARWHDTRDPAGLRPPAGSALPCQYRGTRRPHIVADQPSLPVLGRGRAAETSAGRVGAREDRPGPLPPQRRAGSAAGAPAGRAAGGTAGTGLGRCGACGRNAPDHGREREREMRRYAMALFGLVGYVLIKLDFEPAPLLLGFVLGPMLEENLRRAMIISRGDATVFLTHPLSLALLLISAAHGAGRRQLRRARAQGLHLHRHDLLGVHRADQHEAAPQSQAGPPARPLWRNDGGRGRRAPGAEQAGMPGAGSSTA